MTCSPVFNDPEGRPGSQSRDVAAWLSPDSSKPDCFETVTDQTTAAHALARTRKGVGLLYKGDYHSARQLLAAMGRRLRKSQRNAPTGPSAALSSVFRAGRDLVRQEHELLSRLAVPLLSGYRVELKRAPDVELACLEALGPPPSGPARLPLRDSWASSAPMSGAAAASRSPPSTPASTLTTGSMLPGASSTWTFSH